MARSLAKSTLKKFQDQLLEEQERLTELIAERERELEEAKATETASERNPDPDSADAASMKFEYMKELSLERNSIDLLRKVEHALVRVEAGTYGICEVCGEPIPVARIEVLPYATTCVTCARKA